MRLTLGPAGPGLRANLWSGRRFATAILAVRTGYLRAHPERVKALLAGDLDATEVITTNPAKAQKDVADLIAKISGRPLKPGVIAAAWKQLEFTVDPRQGLLGSVPDGEDDRQSHREEPGRHEIRDAQPDVEDVCGHGAEHRARG